MIFTRGLLLGVASRITGISEETIEVLALVTPGTYGTDDGGSIPILEAISTKKEKEPSVVVLEIVSIEKAMRLAPFPVSEAVVTKSMTEPLPPVLDVVAPSKKMEPPILVSKTVAK